MEFFLTPDDIATLWFDVKSLYKTPFNYNSDVYRCQGYMHPGGLSENMNKLSIFLLPN